MALNPKLLFLQDGAGPDPDPGPPYPYPVPNAGYFNGVDTDLRRTQTAGNRRTFTISAWVDFKAIEGTRYLWIVKLATNTGTRMFFNGNSQDLTFGNIEAGTYDVRLTTNRVIRDTAAPYHVVVAVDTSQPVAADRQKMYINGVQVLDFRLSTEAPLNKQTYVNSSGRAMRVGSFDTGSFLDGAVSEFVIIDGLQLGADSFGEFHPDTGEWVPKDPSGLTFGVNGCYLKMTENPAGTVEDFSGNNNNFTVRGPYQVGTNTPTNGQCAWNPLDVLPGYVPVFENMNRTVGFLSAASHHSAVGTIEVPRVGSWYWEVVVDATGAEAHIGLAGSAPNVNVRESFRTYRNTGDKTSDASGVEAYGSSFTKDDVIGVHVEDDNLTFYKNGVSQGVAFSDLNVLVTGSWWMPYALGYNGTQLTARFNDDEFQYAPPAGAVALSKAQLPVSEVLNPRDFNQTRLYTGNGGIQNIDGFPFSPDFVWSKQRDNARSHCIYDRVRGATKYLRSDESSAETTEAQGLTAFLADGWTLGTDVKHNANSGLYIALALAEILGGFQIIEYNGTGVAQDIPHSLGKAPTWVWYKQLSGTGWWTTYCAYADAGNGPENTYLPLNTDSAAVNTTDTFNGKPTASHLKVGTSSATNGAGHRYLALVFTDLPGLIRVGYYDGNGNSEGPFLNHGFRPGWHLNKKESASGSWQLYQEASEPHNDEEAAGLFPDVTAAENANIAHVDAVSNGLKLRGTEVNWNQVGHRYVYLALAAATQKYGRAN